MTAIIVAAIIGAGFALVVAIAALATFLEPRLTRVWSAAGIDDRRSVL